MYLKFFNRFICVRCFLGKRKKIQKHFFCKLLNNNNIKKVISLGLGLGHSGFMSVDAFKIVCYAEVTRET